MKKITFLLIASVFLLTQFSCKNDKDGIDLIYTREFNILAGSNTWDTHFYEIPVDVNWSQFLGTLTVDDIDRINPSFATLHNNDGINLDFIREASIEIYPDENTTLTPIEMCYRENIPFNTGNTLNLIPGIADFKDELADGKYIFRIGLDYREFPPATFRVVLDFGFRAIPK